MKLQQMCWSMGVNECGSSMINVERVKMNPVNKMINSLKVGESLLKNKKTMQKRKRGGRRVMALVCYQD